MQRLDAAVEHLGKLCHRGDIRHRNPGLGERPRGAAGREDLDAAGGERPGEREQPRFVVDRDEGPFDAAEP